MFVAHAWLRRPSADAESGSINTAAVSQNASATANNLDGQTAAPQQLPQSREGSAGSAARPARMLPYNPTYSRLTLVCSLLTLSWFLTAHILEYTSINTCRNSSPHLWWLVFGILCIMYLMVLEVVILGFVVLIVAPILFIFWNIFLICIGRHPMQNPNMIKPEVGKLPKSVVDRIPLVMYIPPPPTSQKDATDQSPHSYPPKASETFARPPRVRFRFFRRASTTALRKPNDESADEKNGENGLPDIAPKSWESNWEHGDHPFITLEENQAACAICLMDFEEPKRKNAPEDTGDVSKEQTEGLTAESLGKKKCKQK
ncbi:hypothetical protein NLJ89_g644 [Agrocybe chaxingu]|uniref:Uncharacterized protein n=1 Tax=Agrocybe chaxingu TaxID=84603 RepID=A0A9W8N1I2_9AGAR|nr:hypothetical protein NLJ89_g644 [Agrocybe chaxingu]